MVTVTESDIDWIRKDLPADWLVFRSWLARQKGVEGCGGMPNTDPVLGPLGGDIHVGCCSHHLTLRLPGGAEELPDWVVRWAGEEPGRAKHIAEYCLTRWRRWNGVCNVAHPKGTWLAERALWRRRRAFWLSLTS